LSSGSGWDGEFWAGAAGLVGLAGGEHGEDDVAAAAGQADEGGVVAFALRCVCGRRTLWMRGRAGR
jgi:hypothetical protein